MCVVSFSQEIGVRYLIITHDSFFNAIQPLAQWKHRKGMRTKVVKLSDIGSSSTLIRNYIVNAYNTWQIPPEFLLLVGAPNFLPWSQSYPYTDNNYTNMNSDIYNEILSGRLTVHSETEAQTVVNKILLYEKTPDLQDSLWPISACLIVREDYSTYPPPAGSDDSIYWSDIHHARDLMRDYAYSTVDTLSKLLGNNSSDVIQAVNNGRAFVLYRGSGVSNWWSPFDVNPDATANGAKLPIILSITCSTIGSGSSSASAERWLLTGTPTLPRGGSGYFATTTIITNGAYLRSAVCKGFFEALFEDQKKTFGEACEGGRKKVYTMYNSASEYRGFATLGDPEMNIWTAIPKPLEVAYDSILDIAADSLNVLVTSNYIPVESAFVCVVQDTLVYQSEYTSSDGQVTLHYDSLSLGTMDITVTARNKIPYLDSIMVVSTHVEESTQSTKANSWNISVLPNPLSREASIHFSISQNIQNPRIEIRDNIGRLVKKYVLDEPDGTIIWQGTDDEGNRLPSGIYFLRIVPSGEEDSRPIVLLR
jgi:hypothetical protein